MNSSYRPSLERNHTFAPAKTEVTLVHHLFTDDTSIANTYIHVGVFGLGVLGLGVLGLGVLGLGI